MCFSTKQKRGIKKCVVAATLVLCCGILVNDNTWALVDSITSKIEYYFGANKNEFEEYKMGVEQSASDKNVTLTLKEAMLEDGEFILNINMDFSKKELDKNARENIDPNATWKEVFSKYINDFAEHVHKKGFNPTIWNDGIYYGEN